MVNMYTTFAVVEPKKPGESKDSSAGTSSTEGVVMTRGFIYEDEDEDFVVYRRDGTLIITDENGRQKGEVYFDFDEFIENQDDRYMDTIHFFSMIKGEKYVDAGGIPIVYQKNGKLKYNKVKFDTFELFLAAMSLEFLETVRLYSEDESDSDEEEASIGTIKNRKYSLKSDEAVCLSEMCKIHHEPHPRDDQLSTAAEIHSDVSYTFLDWQAGDGDYETNRAWLAVNQSKMTCILSVSLAKPDSSVNRIDDTRRTMLLNAITGWTDHGWSVLLFVPAQNKDQYLHCAKLKRIFGAGVNIVPYRIDQGTCNNNMNVGESRNAILHFVLANKDLVKTCTVADERVEALLRPRPVLSNSSFSPSDEPIIVSRQRISEGYSRMAATKEFLENGAAAEGTFQTLQNDSNDVWEVLTARENNYCRSVVQLYDADSPETSVWHALNVRGPSLIGLPTQFRANMRKTDPDDLHGSERYDQWGISNGGKFLGADVEPLAPDRLVMPTQLITFKVGVGGWDGQFFYPFTTIGEDNFFSFQWGTQIGAIAQLDAVQIIRKFPRKAVSITRTPDNLTNYTDCAIKELIYILNSDTYAQSRAGAVPTLQWTPLSAKHSMRMSCYKWQCFIFSQISAQAKKRNIRCPSKVNRVCDSLLTFILSKSFRSDDYFVDKNRGTYNAMLEVYRKSKRQKKQIGKLKLKIPKNR